MRPSPSSRSPVIAELGPTNTGKTHRAIERMLEHESGMIGLPLRLLAREVYDRVTARLGEGRVALVTGEEKRIPARASYWVCTVEAMPTERAVDFLAVDEIQLAAHRERGHVFTDRLLHARGRKETWFLGAETMRPILQALIPGASFKRAARMSQLRWLGPKSLKGLPPRSAVVAFSVERVYELAEALRRLRGGVAVVLGGLSPRTRNAQVAMYQSGEVQYLVATDAIGMGLNLDLNHVTFAALSKFDGTEQRDLEPDELAQIAGRAGRHLNDGTFGILSPLPELRPHVVEAIETHRFSPVRSLIWRSAALDFSSPDALLDSLAKPPDHRAFQRVERADDFDALRELVRAQEIREAASNRPGLELLWQVCQIPDFRKRLLGQHVSLLRQIYLQLSAREGRLEDDWLGEQVAPLDDTAGDIHTLMDRLSSVRIWTYVSHHSSWLRDPVHWQERTRRIEDALGDALHQRLVERFVERAARRTPRRFVKAVAPHAASTAAADSPFAKLKLLVGELQLQDGDGTLTEEQFVQQVVDAPHEAFQVDAAGRISFEGEPLARLVRGNDLRAPQIALAEPDAWTGGARRRVERRLVAFARDLITEAMGGFPAEAMSGEGRSAATRGLAYRLTVGLGIVRRTDEVVEQWRLLDGEARQRFNAQGVREGQRFFHVEQALSPHALFRRGMLAALFEQRPIPEGAPGKALLERAELGGFESHLLGYEPVGPIFLRIDLVERIAHALRHPGSHPQAQTLLAELGVQGGLRARVIRELRGGPAGVTAKPSSRRRRRRGRRGGPSQPPAEGKREA